MFKKLSLVGLLVTVAFGTTAYGMDPQDNPETRRRPLPTPTGAPVPQNPEEKAAPNKALERARQQEQEGELKAAGLGFGNLLLSSNPQGPSLMDFANLFGKGEKLQRSMQHAKERDENKANYGVYLTNNDLIKFAVNDPDEALISLAAVNPTLETLLITNRPDLAHRINIYKPQ